MCLQDQRQFFPQLPEFNNCIFIFRACSFLYKNIKSTIQQLTLNIIFFIWCSMNIILYRIVRFKVCYNYCQIYTRQFRTNLSLLKAIIETVKIKWGFGLSSPWFQDLLYSLAPPLPPPQKKISTNVLSVLKFALTMFRSSHPQVFFKIGILEKLVKFTVNNCARVSFLIRLANYSLSLY